MCCMFACMDLYACIIHNPCLMAPFVFVCDDTIFIVSYFQCICVILRALCCCVYVLQLA